ncbi:MAG TPA: NAD(P)H-binding protein [Candidatus Dormibacteraeota bacterium]
MAGKILVSGAPGKVGTELVRLLANRGVQLRVLVHHVERSGEVSHPGVEVVEGDLTDAAGMRGALRGVETLFLASSASDGQVAVQAAAIEAAVEAGVGRVVKLSAYGAAEGSSVPFLDWHGQTEETLRRSGARWTLIRPYLYMQTLLMNVPTIQAQAAIFNCGDGSRIPFIDARDVAECAAAVLTSDGHDGAVYELSGPASLTWPEVAASIGAMLGRSVRYVPVTADAMATALSESGMPAWLVNSLVALMKFHKRDGGRVTRTVDTLTGRPARALAVFLRDYAPAFESGQPARA